MNSSQLHLPSLEKGQMKFYGYGNYPGQHGQGAPQHQQQQPQYAVPPNSNVASGGGGEAVSQQQAQGIQYYPGTPAQQHQQKPKGAQGPASSPSVTDLTQFPFPPANPSLLFHFQSPYYAPQQERKRPWWMWTIGVIDIIAALLFTAKVVHNVVTKDRFIADRDTLMWTFFLIFLSLCVQLFMGLGLLVGLKSEQDGTTFWYCQTWICGAYFLFGETSVLLLGILLKLQSGGNDIGAKLLIVVLKTTFRVVSFILVRRFMNDLRGKSQYRLSAIELEQYQQQRMQQIQQLQQYQEEHQQHHHQQQPQQQYLLEQNSDGGGGGTGGRRGARGSECYYYAPQMSMMMNMMMNQDAPAAVPIPT